MHNFDKTQRMKKFYAHSTKRTQNNKFWKFQLSWANPSQIFSKAKITRFEILLFKKKNTEHDR